MSFGRWAFYCDIPIPFTNVVLIVDAGWSSRIWIGSLGWRRKW